MPGVRRRGFLAGAAGTVGVASAGMMLSGCDDEPSNSGPNTEPLTGASVTFDGPHQAGIRTPTQASLNLAGFNLKDGVDGNGVARLMRLWTEDARELASGRNPLSSLEPEMVEWPANLTITCGFGERIFHIANPNAKPQWLHDIPAVPREALRDEWGQTDLVLQICSDDPVMGAWALRHMTRAGMDYVDPAWLQQGFMNAYGSIPKGQTPRNLFGQVDGTVNPHTDKEYAEQVFADDGSSSLVVRRIAMDLDDWERLDRTSREVAVGRRLDDGAPLTGSTNGRPISVRPCIGYRRGPLHRRTLPLAGTPSGARLCSQASRGRILEVRRATCAVGRERRRWAASRYAAAQ